MSRRLTNTWFAGACLLLAGSALAQPPQVTGKQPKAAAAAEPEAPEAEANRAATTAEPSASQEPPAKATQPAPEPQSVPHLAE